MRQAWAKLCKAGFSFAEFGTAQPQLALLYYSVTEDDAHEDLCFVLYYHSDFLLQSHK